MRARIARACAAPAPSARPASTARSSSASGSSSSSGRLLHRKNDSREASSRSLSVRTPSAAALDAIQEVRAGEDRRERVAHAALEAAALAALLVEAHQRREIFVGHRPAERAAARDCAMICLGAGALLGRLRRLADEDLAGGSAESLRPLTLTGPLHLEGVHRLTRCCPPSSARRSRRTPLVALGVAAAQERHRDVVLAGRGVETDVASAGR